MSSSSSLISGNESNTSFSNTKWHVEHANSPPHAPSSSMSLSCATSSNDCPSDASTLVLSPSASTNVMFTVSEKSRRENSWHAGRCDAVPIGAVDGTRATLRSTRVDRCKTRNILSCFLSCVSGDERR
ncbi:TPA: hypothetical protein N0F65_004169 [Lagenidium giganteum]|uniref:Uncharacterized protein n=1 Tax=Lagenidium giganteum TaxID=4803 RepID=A0AAV2ZE13_9STRA|nr:TPA: hypothetical protein N0F65_004169 [Lagenidium giganteum]